MPRTSSSKRLAAVAGAAPMTRGTIVFRNVDQRRPSFYGFIGRAALDDPAAREIVPLPCARIYFAADRGLCLEPAGAILKQKVTILDRRLKPVESLTLRGIPNRARISPDGHYGAVTFFVTGHSYADPGSFSTETTLIDLRSGKAIANLEDFDVTHDGEKLESPDSNFWGVTFAADRDRFYATLATRGKTYLIEGSVSGRTARVLHENVECPSLSPDGTRIAYKKLMEPGRWRLYTLNLETMQETPLAETRNVDDQAEWLDDGRVLYGLDESIWVVAADGSSEPRRLLSSADSPAVVRPA